MRLVAAPSSIRSILLSTHRAMALALLAALLSVSCSSSATCGRRTRVFFACMRHTISFS